MILVNKTCGVVIGFSTRADMKIIPPPDQGEAKGGVV